MPGPRPHCGGGGQPGGDAAHDLPQGLCPLLHGGWQTEGKAFSYFSDNAKRIAYLDETATAVLWGLRSPDSNGNLACNINTGGTVFSGNVYGAYFAPRPAFNLKSSIVVSDSTDSDGCYTVESVPGNDGGLYVKNNGLWVRAV